MQGNILSWRYLVLSSISSFVNTGDSSAHFRSAGNWKHAIVWFTSDVIDGAISNLAVCNNLGGNWSNPVALHQLICDIMFSIYWTDTGLRVNNWPSWLLAIFNTLWWSLYISRMSEIVNQFMFSHIPVFSYFDEIILEHLSYFPWFCYDYIIFT